MIHLSLLQLCVHCLYENFADLRDRLSSLPHSLLELVFSSFLRWKDNHIFSLVNPDRLWWHMDHCRFLTATSIMFLLERVPAIQSLSLSCCTSVNLTPWTRCSSSYLYLRCLDISGISVAHGALKSIPRLFPNLQFLSFAGTGSHVQERMVMKVLQGLPSLLSLNLGMHVLSPGLIKVLVKNCRSLQQLSACTHLNHVLLMDLLESLASLNSLSITFTSVGKDSAALAGFDDEMAKLGEALKGGRKLALQELSISPLSDHIVEGLAYACPNLRALAVLTGTDKLAGAYLGLLSSSCLSLSALKLPQCVGVQPSHVLDLGLTLRRCTPSGLDQLSLSGCFRLTDEAIVSVCEGSIKLTYLDLSGLHSMTSAGLSDSIRHCGHSLQTLDLSECSRLTDAAAASIAKCCPRLQSLSLYHDRQISDDGIAAICQHCASLRVLNIYGLGKITDESGILLGRNLHLISELDVSGCQKLTDVTFHQLAIGCSGLSQLSMLACNLVTDDSMTLIARHCVELQRLVINWCSRLTDATLFALARGLNKCIEIISIVGCHRMTTNGFVALLDRCATSLRRISVSTVCDIDGGVLEYAKRMHNVRLDMC